MSHSPNITHVNVSFTPGDHDRFDIWRWDVNNSCWAMEENANSEAFVRDIWSEQARSLFPLCIKKGSKTRRCWLSGVVKYDWSNRGILMWVFWWLLWQESVSYTWVMLCSCTIARGYNFGEVQLRLHAVKPKDDTILKNLTKEVGDCKLGLSGN